MSPFHRVVRRRPRVGRNRRLLKHRFPAHGRRQKREILPGVVRPQPPDLPRRRPRAKLLVDIRASASLRLALQGRQLVELVGDGRRPAVRHAPRHVGDVRRVFQGRHPGGGSQCFRLANRAALKYFWCLISSSLCISSRSTPTVVVSELLLPPSFCLTNLSAAAASRRTEAPRP